jgi:hypothetical protein
MNKLYKLYLLIGCASLLSGCVTNEPYAFAEGEKAASIKFLGMGRISFCRTNQFYSFTPVENSDLVRVPVGERVSVGSFMHFSGYNVSYSCYPFLSFLPEEGKTYVIDNSIRGSKCFIEVVREDKSKATGVSLETSVGPRDCFLKEAESTK